VTQREGKKLVEARDLEKRTAGGRLLFKRSRTRAAGAPKRVGVKIREEEKEGKFGTKSCSKSKV